jgi:amidase
MSQQWREISKQRLALRQAKIPIEWLLKDIPGDHVLDVMDIPRKCGILSERELDITEKYDATSLVEKLAVGALSSVEVTKAFCKRAAVAQQLVLFIAFALL